MSHPLPLRKGRRCYVGAPPFTREDAEGSHTNLGITSVRGASIERLDTLGRRYRAAEKRGSMAP